MSHRVRIDVEESFGALCDTCQFGAVRRALGSNRRYVICRANQGMERITYPMDICSDYRDRAHVDLYDMKKIAWLVNGDPKKSTIGFVRPEDQKKNEYDNTSKELDHLEDKLPKELKGL